MNTTVLSDINLAVSGVLLLGFIFLLWRHLKTDRLRREFFASGLKKDLEQILIDQNRGITKLNQELETLDQNLTKLKQKTQGHLQKTGFIRFNPFDDAGGNISFTLALLNNQDNGIVISSLHGREGTRVYAKLVTDGKSETQLTEEEMRAIKEAN